MTLELEKLRDKLAKIASAAGQQQQRREAHLEILLAALHHHAADWDYINQRLQIASERSDPHHYRSAHPLHTYEPMDTPISPPMPPPAAIIVSTDGSQILPNRHTAFSYYVINVGGIIYTHGNPHPPVVFSEPEIHYLGDTLISSSEVSIQRDLAEIGWLAHTIEQWQDNAPITLGILDQRLLYWPIGGQDALSGNRATKVVDEWGNQMTAIRQSGALLAGYIDRPGKQAVLTLLQALIADETFDWKSLGRRELNEGVTDAYLFGHILQPGQRSCVFVDISPPNERFTHSNPANQVCFFYLNPGQIGRRAARVDIPMWVARDPQFVTAVHALIYQQCRVLGDYPYVLARADEMAVVTKREKEELDWMIELYMQDQGLAGEITAKQESKDIARGAKTRHQGVW